MVVSREVWGLRDGTPPNKEKPFQTRENLSKQGKHQQTRKTPTNKKKPFQTRKHQQTRKTPTNKGNTFRARETPFKQGKYISGKETPFKQGKHLSSKENTFRARKRLSSKGYLPIKCKSLQVVGVSSQGEAVVSDGGYGVIGG